MPDHADARAALLLHLLDQDDLDAAIDAGLPGFDPDACTHLAMNDRMRLCDARDRLLQAWDARERHRIRNARLARRTAEREARRRAAAEAGKTGLPSAAAAALARARAKAGGRPA